MARNQSRSTIMIRSNLTPTNIKWTKKHQLLEGRYQTKS